jgi:uncharacterized protein YukJ
MANDIKNYGLWVGKPTDFTAERSNIDSKSPHIQLHFQDDNGEHRAAINVKSTDRHDSRLVYWLNRTLQNSVTDKFKDLGTGFQLLQGEDGLDYIRHKLVEIAGGLVLPHDAPGPNNDIIDELTPILQDGIDRKATIYIFGSRFDDNNGGEDGIHDIHMNQGSLPRYANGVFQDGGLFLYFEDDGHWEGVFLAFASQKVPTYDDTGKPKHGAKELVEIIQEANQDGGE